MSKYISQLPEDIRVIALQRQREENSVIINISKNNDVLNFAFNWRETPEKREIWSEVYAGNYAPFREFHAKLKESEEKKPVTLQWVRENFNVIIDEPSTNGWISVEDRLPENIERVLVNCEYGVTLAEFTKYTSGRTSWWAICSIGTYEDSMLATEVTHWQPLPEPPKTH